ncbi:Alpha/Beta hydrolase fold [Amanita muscaria]
MTVLPVLRTQFLSGKAKLCAHRRLFSAIAGTSEPVDLDYTLQIPQNGNTTEKPLVILHGLFGSKRNWTSLTKAFVSNLQRPIYALDLRNHGSSPHAAPMTYEHMATDVLHFFKKHKLQDVCLLGHSMSVQIAHLSPLPHALLVDCGSPLRGGKVAMSVALNQNSTSDNEDAISSLIVADIAPIRATLSQDFVEYIHIMSKIEQMGLKTRSEAGKVLEEYEKDPSIRQFLLTNLVVPPASSPKKAKFQVPLSLLNESISLLGSFPYEPGNRLWQGKTLVIKGSKSKYINRHNIPTIEAFFPDMRLEVLDAGHWVHAEKPHEFMKLVVDFIGDRDNN